MVRRLYLAGPDVFAPDARALGDRRRALCAKWGFEGLFPLAAESVRLPYVETRHGHYADVRLSALGFRLARSVAPAHRSRSPVSAS